MTELTVMLVTILGGVAVAVTVKPEDSGGVPSLRCRDTGLCLLPPAGCSFYPFFFLLPVCLSRSPYRYPQLFLSFNCYGPFSLKTVGLSLSLGLSFPFSVFFFLFYIRAVFIGAGGAGSTLAHPIASHAWGARRLLCHGAGRGGQWRRRLRGTAALASHHEVGGV